MDPIISRLITDWGLLGAAVILTLWGIVIIAAGVSLGLLADQEERDDD